jgi:uncharacterized protein
LASPPAAQGAIFDRSPVVFYLSTVDGQTKNRVDIDSRALELEFTEGGKKANKFKVTLADLTLQNSSLKQFIRGTKLVMQWGYVGNLSPEYAGVVQKVSGNQKLVIEGMAKVVNFSREQKIRTFTGMSTSQIVKQILTENGYSSSALDIEDTQVVYDSWLQANQTDAQFIRSLADWEGFEWGDDFDGFHFRRATFEAKPVQEFVYYTSQRGDILKFSTEGRLAVPVTSVTRSAVDPMTKKVVTGTGDPTTPRGGVAAQVDIAAAPLIAPNNQLGQKYIKPHADPTSVTRTAQRQYIAATRANFKLKLEIIGDPKVRSKTVVQVSNIGKDESGRYYINSVETHVKGNHYTCKLDCRTDRGQGQGNTMNSTAKRDPGSKDPNALEAKQALDHQNNMLGAKRFAPTTGRQPAANQTK